MLAALAPLGHNATIMKKPRLAIDDLRTALQATSPNSKLGRWFIANQAEFEVLLKTVRPRWEVMAVKFAEEGLITVPPEFWRKDDSPERQLARKRAGETARHAWLRLKRKSAKAPRPTLRPPPVTAVRRSAPAPVDDADQDEFRPVRPRRR